MRSSSHATVVIFIAVVAMVTEVCFAEYQFKATCIMEANRKPPSGETHPIKGTVTMTQRSLTGLTFIKIRLTGLRPYKVFGFHVHEYGDIISQGCQSTGGHYSPFNRAHGAPRDRIRHVADLGNIMSGYYGNVRTSFRDPLVSLRGTYSVIGRALVLHAKRDDLGRARGRDRAGSLKTGNAGVRLACCVIVHTP